MFQTGTLGQVKGGSNRVVILTTPPPGCVFVLARSSPAFRAVSGLGPIGVRLGGGLAVAAGVFGALWGEAGPGHTEARSSGEAHGEPSGVGCFGWGRYSPKMGRIMFRVAYLEQPTV